MTLSDRRLVELALPAGIVWTVARSIVRQVHLTEQGKAVTDRLLALLRTAANEPFEALQERERLRLRRRCDREIHAVNANLVDEPVLACLVAVHELLRALLDAGDLELIAGSAFDQGWSGLESWILDGVVDIGQPPTDVELDEWAETAQLNRQALDRIEPHGRQLGQRLLAACKSRGYYTTLARPEKATAAA